MSKITAITGPTGSGKTTISEAIAKRLDKCVSIDADHIKHMIPSGFHKDDSNPGGWNYSEWGLVGENVGLLAKNFYEKGFDVVINGYIDEPAWTEIEKVVSIDHKILLLPDNNTNKARDAERTSDIQMGADAVVAHREHFLSDSIYEDFERLDTSSDTVEQTVNRILEITEAKLN